MPGNTSFSPCVRTEEVQAPVCFMVQGWVIFELEKATVESKWFVEAESRTCQRQSHPIQAIQDLPVPLTSKGRAGAENNQARSHRICLSWHTGWGVRGEKLAEGNTCFPMSHQCLFSQCWQQSQPPPPGSDTLFPLGKDAPVPVSCQHPEQDET